MSGPDSLVRILMYYPKGVCSQVIDVTADENDVIQLVFFIGGCDGNLQGISQLVLRVPTN